MISLTCGIRVEAPSGGTEDPLFEDGWNADQQWTPRQRDLTEPTEDPGVRIKVGAGAGARAHCRTMTGVRPSEAHRRAHV